MRRFWDKVHVPDSDVWEDECWPWTAGRNRSGHGSFGIYRRGEPNTTMVAHRMAYKLVNGHIDDDLVLHHECENPGCVNPAHLTPMTTAEHTSHHRQVTHCLRGHEFTDENTYVRSDGTGRTCRICKVMNKKARRRMGME